jgi:chemotaxis protein CheZ
VNTIDIDTLNVRIRGLVDVLRDEEQDQVGIADVASVAEVLITIMQRYFGTIDVSLYQEFQELSAHIAQTRTEIAKLQAGKIQGEKLPSAGQELDAIVAATEEATNTIMEAAEQMMEGDASDSDAYKATVDAACMRIFEACSFQDITGQRIGKVVGTLTYIEDRISGLLGAHGVTAAEEAAVDDDEEVSGDEALLNGPQLEGEGNDQDDIDAMFD